MRSTSPSTALTSGSLVKSATPLPCYAPVMEPTSQRSMPVGPQGRPPTRGRRMLHSMAPTCGSVLATALAPLLNSNPTIACGGVATATGSDRLSYGHTDIYGSRVWGSARNAPDSYLRSACTPGRSAGGIAGGFHHPREVGDVLCVGNILFRSGCFVPRRYPASGRWTSAPGAVWADVAANLCPAGAESVVQMDTHP